MFDFLEKHFIRARIQAHIADTQKNPPHSRQTWAAEAWPLLEGRGLKSVVGESYSHNLELVHLKKDRLADWLTLLNKYIVIWL